jgi:hypothetical protein
VTSAVAHGQRDFLQIWKDELRDTVGEKRDALNRGINIVGHMQAENGDNVPDKDELHKVVPTTAEELETVTKLMSKADKVIVQLSHEFLLLSFPSLICLQSNSSMPSLATGFSAKKFVFKCALDIIDKPLYHLLSAFHASAAVSHLRRCSS